MVTWSRSKVDSSAINNGNEYEKGDRVSREQLNAMVNAGFYAQDFAEALSDTPDTTEANLVGVPNVELIDYVKNGKSYKKFKFANLKGEKGDKGDPGERGEMPDMSNYYTKAEIDSKITTALNTEV